MQKQAVHNFFLLRKKYYNENELNNIIRCWDTFIKANKTVV